MFGMIIDSMKLFFAGRLFQDYKKVIQLFIVGMLCGVVAIIVVGHFASPIVAAMAGGAVSGALQPFLFRNLKYR